MSKSRRATITILIAMLVAAFTVGFVACSLNQPKPNPMPTTGTVTAYVRSAGEALSVLIDDDDTEVMIDAGHDRDGPALADKVAPYVADGTIEYVIATHRRLA
jgi:glyoxylase-like metal-dependent hydrolase (beta-lactamase superfamily II)